MSNRNSLRTFIAVKVPCPESLSTVLRELGRMGKAVRAVEPTGLHCTLKFLGDTAPETVTALGPALAAAVGDFPAFRATLSTLGAFPHAQRPSVVWAGIQSRELKELSEIVEGITSQFGFLREAREFRPHVTLARIRFRPPPELARLLQQHEQTPWGTWEIRSIELYQSTPQPGGSRYDVLSRAPLQAD